LPFHPHYESFKEPLFCSSLRSRIQCDRVRLPPALVVLRLSPLEKKVDLPLLHSPSFFSGQCRCVSILAAFSLFPFPLPLLTSAGANFGSCSRIWSPREDQMNNFDFFLLFPFWTRRRRDDEDDPPLPSYMAALMEEPSSKILILLPFS